MKYIFSKSLFSLLLFTNYAISQVANFSIPDSLNTKNIEDLKTAFIKNLDSIDNANIYAKTIILKSKKEKDTLNILIGYKYISHLNAHKDIYLSYSDSIIKLSKKINKPRYTSLAYFNKAVFFHTEGKIKESLDNYIIAKKHSGNLPRINMLINNNIGSLKTKLGQDEEAIEIFKEVFLYFNTKEKDINDTDNYLKIISSLASTYNRLEKYDSTTYYNKLGIKESLAKNKMDQYYLFLLNKTINQFDIGDFLAAKENIQKIEDNIHHLSKSKQIVTYHYNGKVSLKLNEKEKAIKNFHKVDSLFRETGNFPAKARESYEHLINHYKKEEKKEKQLIYIEQLLRIDSIINTNHKYVSYKIKKEYDQPKLISVKETIIKELENKNANKSNWILIMIIILVICASWIFYYYQKQKKLQERFNTILELKEEKKKNLDDDQNKRKKTNTKGISEELVASILAQIDNFEKNNGFIEQKLTIISLSKKFKTNPNYLSKIINTYKNNSFSIYINDLRIEYVIEKLKEDRLFRNYTIKAIAREVGFNNTESFSKYFYKKTELNPSYFIKELNNSENHISQENK